MKKNIAFGLAVMLLVSTVGVAMGGLFGQELVTNELMDDVIEIRTWADLHNMRDDLTANYTLMNDLGPSDPGYDDYNTGAGWLPVGPGPWSIPENNFQGIFDGQGHTITGLYIDRSGTNDIGLFGFVGEYGEVRNVGLVNANVIGNWYAGGLIGTNGGTVSNSYATGTVRGGNWYAGGLVGWNLGMVENSYASVDATGSVYVGGLVGENQGTVSNSYATGDVSGSEYVGGLVGRSWTSVSNSYATGTVSGSEYVGGLVGYNWGGTVWNSYATGTVSSSGSIGGLVGQNYWGGTVSNSFWDTDISRIDVSDGGIGLPTAQMKMESTFTSAGWNFHGIWWMVEGATYPMLFYHDSKPPMIHILSPIDGIYFCFDEVSVSWVGSDLESGLSHYNIRINEGNWTDVGQETNHAFSDLDEGNHTVDVMAFDHAGNSAMDSVTFAVDLTPPEIEIISPEDGAVFADSYVTVRWNGSDSISGIAFYEIRLNYGGWLDDPGTDPEFTFYALNVMNYRVDVRATDRAGNRATHNITFNLAMSSPTINITSPAEGVETLYFDENFTIEGYTESGSSLWINGVSVDVDGDGNFTYETTLVEGINLFKVMAENQAGKTAETTVYALYLPQIRDLLESIGYLQAGISRNRYDIATLQKELDSLDIDLGPLTERLSSLEDALQENYTALEVLIIDNVGNISEIQQNIYNISGNITDIWVELHGLGDYLSDAEITALLGTLRDDMISELQNTLDNYVMHSDLEIEEQDDDSVSPLAVIGLIAAVLAILIALFALFKKGETEGEPLNTEGGSVDYGSHEPEDVSEEKVLEDDGVNSD